MGILAVVVLVTLLVSATCSLLESALYSTRVATLEAARAEGRHARAAAEFLRMKQDISRPTSAVLILNTVANTAGATIAGMYAAELLGSKMVPAFSGGLTLAILFFAEIMPKTFGAARWKSLWFLIAWPLVALERVLAPLIWVTQKFSRLVTSGSTLAAVTEDEIRATIRMGARAGELKPSELRMLDAVMQFDDVLTRHVMVPRTEVVILDADAGPDAWMAVARKTKHTRFPLCRGSLDHVLGLINGKDFVGVAPDDLDLGTIVRPIERVPGTLPISRLLRQMQESQRHMALVIDEFGGVIGVVTLENVIEQIVGALQDEFDAEPPEIDPAGKREYVVAGWIALARLDRELRLDLYAPDVDTLSGLLVTKLGRLPKVGDRLELAGSVIAEVAEIRGDRASRVRLTLPEPLIDSSSETAEEPSE